MERLNRIVARAMGTTQDNLKRLRELEDDTVDLQEVLEELQGRLLHKLKNHQLTGGKPHPDCAQLYQQIVVVERQLEAVMEEKVRLAEDNYGLVADDCEEFDEVLGEEWRQLEFNIQESKYLQDALLSERYTTAILQAAQLETDNYCTCEGRPASNGPMIQCEAQACPKRWYHLDCLGMDPNTVP